MYNMILLFCKLNLWLVLSAGQHADFKEPVTDTMEIQILQFVNEDRKQHGLAILQINSMESSLAARHSHDMASGKVKFGHDGFNARARTIQKSLGSMEVGENVASGPMTAREVVDGWLKSPGHKKNIEGDFTLTGIGYARDKKGDIYFTQIFSK
jgi:uncharacterized protein YkwD